MKLHYLQSAVVQGIDCLVIGLFHSLPHFLPILQCNALCIISVSLKMKNSTRAPSDTHVLNEKTNTSVKIPNIAL